MRRSALIMSTVMFVCLAAAPGAQPPGGAVEQELIALDKRLAEAESKNDHAAVDRILAADYTLTDTTGRVSDRTRAMSVLKSGATHKATMTTSDYKVRVLGDVAIMTHAATIKGPEHVEQLRTTHVWVKRDGRWQLSADQCTTVAFPQIPTDVPFLNAACSEASFAPEVQQFYGTPASIQQKLETASMQLDKRRVYVLLVEADTSAQLTLFDRASAEDKVVKVAQWHGQTAGDLRDQLSTAIMENRGVACIGETSKRVVQARFAPREIARIQPPATARAAFSHLLNVYRGDYVRATVFLLC